MNSASKEKPKLERPDREPNMARSRQEFLTITLIERHLQSTQSNPEGFLTGGDEGLLVGLLLGHELKRQRAVGGGGHLTDGKTSRQKGSRGIRHRRIARNAICEHVRNSN